MTIIDKELARSPKEEFLAFCESRLAGLALTLSAERLQTYRDAAKVGAERLAAKESRK